MLSFTNQQLAREVVSLAKQNKVKITTAESCTGGLLAGYITTASGSSEIFDLGHVTYSNQAKSRILDIPNTLIEKYGAISEEVAELMAKSAREMYDQDLAISITGIAGPAGGSDVKPVGLVYIGHCYKDQYGSKKYMFQGNRDEVREQACKKALETIKDLITNKIK
jgi:PncC family amidohydrolase